MNAQVFTEMDPSNIPWQQAGVNYVIEATESLKKKVDGTEHLKPKDGLVKSPTMKDLVNRKNSDSINGDQSPENPTSDVKTEEGDKPVTNGVRKVVLASNSTDVPSIGIGINEDRLRRDTSVISSISAPANALLIALKVALCQSIQSSWYPIFAGDTGEVWPQVLCLHLHQSHQGCEQVGAKFFLRL